MDNDNYIFYENGNVLEIETLTYFIEQIDSTMIDPINERSYFISYEILARKFLKNAEIISCFLKKMLIGIAVFYAKPNSYKYAYETFLGVLDDYRGKGIGLELMMREIKLCKEIGMDAFMTNCHKNNHAKKKINNNAGLNLVEDEELIRYFCSINDRWIGKDFYTIKL